MKSDAIVFIRRVNIDQYIEYDNKSHNASYLGCMNSELSLV